jgi:Flp pilus assembly protein TadD
MESHPSEAELIFEDATGDIALGELEAAELKYRRCTELAPDFFEGWHAWGMVLMKLGRFPEAIAAGRIAVDLRPDDQLAWSSLSLFYVRNGQIPEAESAGAKARVLGWKGQLSTTEKATQKKETPGTNRENSRHPGN